MVSMAYCFERTFYEIKNKTDNFILYYYICADFTGDAGSLRVSEGTYGKY